MTTTYDDTPEPPAYARGLPAEIHFWKHDGCLFLLRGPDGDAPPTWCLWREGQAVRDVGAEGASG